MLQVKSRFVLAKKKNLGLGALVSVWSGKLREKIYEFQILANKAVRIKWVSEKRGSTVLKLDGAKPLDEQYPSSPSV